MCRRIRRSVHWIVGVRKHERHASLRLLIHLPLNRPRSPEIIDSPRIALSLRDGLKSHHDFLLFARRNRKDSRTQETIPHPFEQRRIALPADDLLIDLPRTVGAHCLAGDHLAIDREFQILERRALRQRKHEIRFAYPASAIDEHLGDLVAKHVIHKIDAHVTALSYYTSDAADE